MPLRTCRICGSTADHESVLLPEIMFGTGESFEYFQCGGCGTLQIAELPANMPSYYPDNYYSYGVQPGSARLKLRNALSIWGPSWLFAGKDWWESPQNKAIRDAGLKRSDKVLDLGCGSGSFIAQLADLGFTNVLGADPYVSEEIAHPNGARVIKREASEVEGSFDVVMIHHALEHVWDQQSLAREMARLTKPGGRCIVRIPTVDCWAWEEYGPEWIQLDPPRHFYLHSRKSIAALLEGAGLKVDRIIDDSGAFQIWGSEKVRRGQPLVDDAAGNISYDIVPAAVRQSASARARELNRLGKGDAIAVHAHRP